MRYNVGLDIQTTGVGWSVTDENGCLVKRGEYHLFGTSMFDEAQTAEERRRYRAQRRKKERAKQRIKVLQSLLAPEVLDKDNAFYIRLEETPLNANQRSKANLYHTLPEYLFEDNTVQIMAARTLPIYEIRKELLDKHRKADIRYVYMAIAHILKHRGLFLEESAAGKTEEEAVADIVGFLRYLNDEYFAQIWIDHEDIRKAVRVLIAESDTKTILKKCKGLFGSDMPPAVIAMLSLLNGETVKVRRLFSGYTGAAKGGISFAELDSNREYDEFTEDMNDAVQRLMEVYLWKENTKEAAHVESVSGEMTARYARHKEDLRRVKAWFRKYAPERYAEMFHSDLEKVNYNAYTGSRTGEQAMPEALDKNTQKANNASWNTCTQEAFYNRLREIFQSVDAQGARAEAEGFLARMYDDSGAVRENGFLPLQRHRANSAIRHIQHQRELEQILDNQEEFHPVIRENKGKILALGNFRIPYYVGPLRQDASSPFTPWIQYRAQGKGHILPWDMEERVDLEATAENWIRQATNNCSYIPEEKVLPRHSLYYEEYMLLNELNTIYISYEAKDEPEQPSFADEGIKGKRKKRARTIINKDIKARLITELFARQKKVTPEHILEWLRINVGRYRYAKGLRLENSLGKPVTVIKSSMPARVDLERIMGERITREKYDRYEKIILWSTVYKDRKIYKKRIHEAYAEEMDDSRLRQVEGLRYSGWGRFSKRLLSEPLCMLRGKKVSLLEFMETEHSTFMYVYKREKTELRDNIQRINNAAGAETPDYTDVQALPCSPAIRRGVWQAVRILRELEEVMGGKPDGIYIRNLRESSHERSQEEQKALSRYRQIRERYDRYEKNTGEKVDKELRARLEACKKSMTDTEFLYLSQLGKCMYTGDAIRLNEVNRIIVDNVIPKSISTDHSINNQVLVIRNKRTPGFPLSPAVIASQEGWWNTLAASGLISDSKLRRLTTRNYDSDTIDYYVQKQLTDRSLIIERTTYLFKRYYPEATVYGINSSLSNYLRDEINAPCIRSLNDTHQAYDAFLTAHIGAFVYKYMPDMTQEGSRKQIYMRDLQRKGQSDKNGIIVTCYSRQNEDEGKPGSYWSGPEARKDYLRKVYLFRDGYVTYKTKIYTGKFYNETLYRPAEGSDEKSSHQKEYTAHMAMIAYTENGEEVKELINVPARIAALSAGKGLGPYLRAGMGYTEDKYPDIRLVMEKIPLNQEVEIRYTEGDRTVKQAVYLRSATEWRNARQLYVRDDVRKRAAKGQATVDMLADSMLNTIQKALTLPAKNTSMMSINAGALEEALRYLAGKFCDMYPVYQKLRESIRKVMEKEDALTNVQRMLLIRILVRCMNTQGERVKQDISAFNALSENEEIRIDGDNRLNNRRLKGKNIYLVHRSVTGIYAQKQVE